MEAPVSAGEVLAGKYRVQRVLGVGGMGVVVAADDLLLERRVAIKFLLNDGLQNPEVVARFAREARSAVRIESEHIARVIDVGSLPSGSPYIVMEYLEGSDLAHRVTASGALPVPEAIDYVLQACEAIAEAHALGIVHRDLKPANLFLTRRTDGAAFVKVLDFGISKAASGARGSQPDMSLTKTSAVMGSPMYMAPEQMRSTRAVDARADIWALGVILYELISGKVPFEATTMPELCAMVLTEPPPSLRERCPWVPAAVASAVERCLQKDPAQRFSNVSELANALVGSGPEKSRLSAERISRVLRAAGIDTLSIRPDAAPLESRPGESTSAAWGPTTASTTRHSSATPAIAIGALLLISAGVGVVLLVSGHKTSVDSGSSSAAAVPVSPTASSQLVAVATASAAPTILPQAPAEPSPPSSSASTSAPQTSAALTGANAVTPAAPPLSPHRLTGAAKISKPVAVAAVPPAVATPAPAPPPAAAKPRNPLDIGLK